MAKDEDTSIAAYFSIIQDPRVERTRQHSLHDILVIAICAVICGADGWVAVEQFGRSKEEWFRSFLDLAHGIPSHDTFGRVFAALDTQAFTAAFVKWMAAIANLTDGEVVAIDGKTLRRSFDRASAKAAIHMVSAWAQGNHVVLGQVKTEEKSNEITAIPRLLDLLDIKGCIVTIDAMGCQKEIAAKIVEKGADYMLCLKGNHEKFHMEIQEYFKEALVNDFDGVTHDYAESTEKGHGRVEIRRAWCTDDLDWFEHREDWAGLSSIGMIERECVENEERSIEQRYFIASIPGDDAPKFLHTSRVHWGIESMHWILDVAFREDDCRVRVGNAAANLGVLRHVALNLLKQEKTLKVGIKNKRLRAGWDESYMVKVLGV